MNSLPAIWEAKRSQRPPPGAYLIDFGNDISLLTFSISKIEEKIIAFVQAGTSSEDEEVRLMQEIGEVKKLSDELRSSYHGAQFDQLFDLTTKGI